MNIFLISSMNTHKADFHFLEPYGWFGPCFFKLPSTWTVPVDTLHVSWHTFGLPLP